MLRRLLLPALAGLGFLALQSGAAQAQGRQDFSLVNRTGYQINEVYVGPVTSNSWGKDILGDGVLEDGKMRNIRFSSRATACKWDIKVVYEDGDESEFRNVDLCSVSRVSLFWNRRAGQTRFVAE